MIKRVKTRVGKSRDMFHFMIYVLKANDKID